ncbi:hypothetical protein [Lysobacter sp. Root494]|uniref:hypothetical protein n=1 Tax=Lysobacter sp. Root494 TaxID=1736549 RepID=UPI0012FA649B|nr:hypothetical protein [Lysobacter sp. Root494]
MLRFTALAVLALLSGCSTTGAVIANSDFTMSAGDKVSLPDASTLRYIGIANDSRCPPDVMCIRAGDADVLFDHTGNGSAASRVTLNTERQRSTSLGKWHLELVDLATRGAAPVVTLRISAGNGTVNP